MPQNGRNARAFNKHALWRWAATAADKRRNPAQGAAAAGGHQTTRCSM